MTSIPIRPFDRFLAHVRRHWLGYWDAAIVGGTIACLAAGGLVALSLLR